MDSCQTHQSGPMYMPSGVKTLKDWLTSLALDSPVSHIPSQAPAVAPETPVIYGLRRSELSVRWHQDTSSWRTSQESLQPPDSEESQPMGEPWLESLPKRGTVSRGPHLGLTMWAHPTDASGGSASEWPTPTATPYGTGNNYKVNHGQPMAHRPSLDTMARNDNWMTPNTFDSLAAKSQEALDHEYTHRAGRKNPNNLRDQVAVQQGERNWPTPIVSYATGNRMSKGSKRPNEGGLQKWAKEWPTPRARDWKGSGPTIIRRDGRSRMDSLDYVTEQSSQCGLQPPAIGMGGPDSSPPDQTSPQPSARKRLNPKFVEYLMGVPLGWTSLEPLVGSGDSLCLEMALCQPPWPSLFAPSLGVNECPECERELEPDQTACPQCGAKDYEEVI